MASGSARQMKRFGFGCAREEAVDGGLQIDDGSEHAVLETSPGEFGEEAFDGVVVPYLVVYERQPLGVAWSRVNQH